MFDRKRLGRRVGCAVWSGHPALEEVAKDAGASGSSVARVHLPRLRTEPRSRAEEEGPPTSHDRGAAGRVSSAAMGPAVRSIAALLLVLAGHAVAALPECLPDCEYEDLTDGALARADLSDTNLRGADLANADLYRADLRDAILRAANLTYATLSAADLRFADLSHAHLFFALLLDADLRQANLRAANLYRTVARDADLSGAVLVGASLENANLSGANLDGADMDHVWAIGVNLSSANPAILGERR